MMNKRKPKQQQQQQQQNSGFAARISNNVALARKGYEQLVHAIIRPPRASYDPTKQLGPTSFLFLGAKFHREDVELESRTNPHYNPKYREEDERLKKNKNEENNPHTFNNFSHKNKLSLKASIWTRQIENDENIIAAEAPPLSKTIVLYLHGNASARLEVIPHLSFLLSLGVFGVCSLDFTGSGLSDGDYVSLGYYERYDLECVLQFLQTRYQNLKIVLWGRSMGAAAALMYASERTRNILHTYHQEDNEIEESGYASTGYAGEEYFEDEPPILQSLDRGGESSINPDSSNSVLKGLILDSPFASLVQLCEELVEKAREQGAILPSLLISLVLNLIARSVYNEARFPLRDISPIDHVTSSRTPALFIVGADDDFIPPHHSEDLVECYQQGVSTNLFMVPGGHNDVRPPLVLEAIKQFLQVRLSLSSSYALRIPDHLAKSNQIYHQPPWGLSASQDVFVELKSSSKTPNAVNKVEKLGMTKERQEEIQNKLHILSLH